MLQHLYLTNGASCRTRQSRTAQPKKWKCVNKLASAIQLQYLLEGMSVTDARILSLEACLNPLNVSTVVKTKIRRSSLWFSLYGYHLRFIDLAGLLEVIILKGYLNILKKSVNGTMDSRRVALGARQCVSQHWCLTRVTHGMFGRCRLSYFYI